MTNTNQKIIILGPPASGKGTQAEFLAEKLGLPVISVGQFLRDEVEKQTKIGQEVEPIMKEGGVAPNAIVNELVKEKLSQAAYQNGFVFDGFPRMHIQAKFLDMITQIDKVILIAVGDEEVLRRLGGRRTCGQCAKVYHLEFNPPRQPEICDECGGRLELRPDDTPEAIHERLKIYHSETEEVIKYYEEKGILVRVNGEQEIEKVKEEIFKKLEL